VQPVQGRVALCCLNKFLKNNYLQSIVHIAHKLSSTEVLDLNQLTQLRQALGLTTGQAHIAQRHVTSTYIERNRLAAGTVNYIGRIVRELQSVRCERFHWFVRVQKSSSVQFM